MPVVRANTGWIDSGGSGPDQPFVSKSVIDDDFEGDKLDTNKWTAYTPTAGASNAVLQVGGGNLMMGIASNANDNAQYKHGFFNSTFLPNVRYFINYKIKTIQHVRWPNSGARSSFRFFFFNDTNSLGVQGAWFTDYNTSGWSTNGLDMRQGAGADATRIIWNYTDWKIPTYQQWYWDPTTPLVVFYVSEDGWNYYPIMATNTSGLTASAPPQRLYIEVNAYNYSPSVIWMDWIRLRLL